ncbi:MAG: cell wall hydrolase, partial [Firmicutes bacterium]|nr:cell wall hydrolase [Bacillota bacterium]
MGNFPDFATMLANTFAEDLMQVVTWIFLVVATLIVPLAIWLGFKLAKAGDPNKRREAKKHMINAIASLIIILILIGAMQIPALWANIGDGGGSGGGGGGGGSGAGWTLHPNVVQAGQSRTLQVTHNRVLMTEATFTIVSGPGTISGSEFTAGATQGVVVVSVSVPGQRVPNMNIIVTNEHVPETTPPGAGGGEPVGPVGPPATIGNNGGLTNVPEEDRHLLARLIWAEARGEYGRGSGDALDPLVAVGAVVVNRVKANFDLFTRDTNIRGAVTRAHQFPSPWASTGAHTAVDNDFPNNRYVRAADAAIAGRDPTNGMHIFWTRWLWEREVNNNFSGQTWVGSVNNVSRTQIYETGTTGPWSTSVPQRGTAGNPGILGEGNVFFQMVQWDNAMGRSLAAPMNFSYGVELFQVGPMLANTFAEDLMQVVTWIFLVVATLIVPLAIWLGFKLAKAGDPNKRREAKKHMINAVASLIIILILIGAMQIPALWANIGDGGGSGGGGGGGGSGAGWTMHPNVMQTGTSHALTLTHGGVVITDATFTVVSGGGSISGNVFTAGSTESVAVISVSVPGQRVPNQQIVITRNE